MGNRLYNWLNRNSNRETAFFVGLKFLYKISTELIHSICVLILTMIISDLYSKTDWKMFWVCLGILIFIEIYFNFVNGFRKYNYQIRRDSNTILDEIVVATTALDDYINTNGDSGKGIFEYASNLATASLYDLLKQVTGCETRISVIQQFREGTRRRKCIMISRKSRKRTSSSKRELIVDYIEKKNYYFLKILKDNKDIYIFFDTKTEVDKNFFWKNNKKRSDIFQYVGIAEKVKTDDIAFLLQIDAMEKNAFGKSKEELSVFLDKYIYPYIQFLKHAYNIERTMRKDDENE